VVGGLPRELKGAQFDREMKLKLTDYFSQTHYFDVFYIRLNNKMLTDEDCFLQLVERNEKTETKYFLENYLNTELTMGGAAVGKFSVTYFDSVDNKLIQIADVFSNLYYSQLQTKRYTEGFRQLREKGILKAIFEIP
jgi:hypothetical protein